MSKSSFAVVLLVLAACALSGCIVIETSHQGPRTNVHETVDPPVAPAN